MSAREEPSYLMFARSNVRGGAMTSPLIVESLLARIDRDESAIEASSSRTITTVEELDALPDEALVLDAHSVGCQKAMSGVWSAGAELITTELIALPATVLYEPKSA